MKWGSRKNCHERRQQGIRVRRKREILKESREKINGLRVGEERKRRKVLSENKNEKSRGRAVRKTMRTIQASMRREI